DGRFYMVTTNVTAGGNFYVWTDDIHGEWSDPVFVEQDGIDPSLFFEDGKAYFMSNGTDESGEQGIVQCRIDIATGKKLTPAKCIWKGAGGRFLESPHLYHIGQYYYLMASEGGTEYGHMVVYARGTSPDGPFENYPLNPVLTNRNLGGYQLQGCGHADLVEDTAGNWWMVHLGFRQLNEWVMHHITGREVYLAPVTFDENGWFTAGVDGTNRLWVETARIPDSVVQEPLRKLTFANTRYGVEWCCMQNPQTENYDLTPERFRLRSNGLTLDDPAKAPTFLGIRQQEMAAEIAVNVQVPAGEAGLTCYMTPEQHYEIGVRRTAGGLVAFRRLRVGDLCVTADETPLSSSPVRLVIEASAFAYSFRAEANGQTYFLGSAQTKYLSTEVAGNFTGVMFGLYAQGDMGESFAEFTGFCCHYPEV
ncbi:MAG: family 43 glycosylhydrolase, partial [Oscillospiraceae bacterium]|nr:family 43 glycosylhydrolase [Oscillospiraceae bacterium]